MRTVSTSRTSPREISPSPDGAPSEEFSDGFVFPASSPLTAKIRSCVAQVARVDVPVLLLGESGVGKEVVARWIHRLSNRGHRTLRIVNCAALPAELLESELFGYEAGAFTGATRSKPGQFELCNKGTILLDEIGELPPSLQAKLLHVLQGGQFSRLGGRSLIEVDVRILAATNVNVPQALASKSLREDLYYRMSALTIHIPPLRERPEEIPVFLHYFMKRFATQLGREPMPFSPRILDACARYSWPGNVRELENFVKRYLILGSEDLVTSSPTNGSQPDAPSRTRTSTLREEPPDLWSLRAVKAEAEKEAILQVLQDTRWRRKDAAERLGISLKALYNKLRLHGISPENTEDADDVVLKGLELQGANKPPFSRSEVSCRRAN